MVIYVLKLGKRVVVEFERSTAAVTWAGDFWMFGFLYTNATISTSVTILKLLC